MPSQFDSVLVVVSAAVLALLAHQILFPVEPLIGSLTPRSLHKSARIAIVGGGVSGLSAAETLVKHGYSNVVVYEAGSSIVPLQHAVHTPEYVYDMDLVYVPALSWTGAGLEARYDAILKEYDHELVPASEFTDVSAEDWHLNTTDLPEIDGRAVPTLHSYAKTVFEPDDGWNRYYEQLRFFRNHAAFFHEHQYNGIQACLSHQLARKDETFDDWTRRYNYPILGQRVAHILGLYGNFPVAESPACQILMILANKMPSIIGPALGFSARQPNFGKWMQQFGPIDKPMMEWLKYLKINGLPGFMRRFKKGYADFFATVVRKTGINYRTNTRVERLVPVVDPLTGRKRVEVEFSDWSSPPVVVDHVIVTGRPDQVHAILPDDHPMKPLYKTVKTESERTTRDGGVYGSAVVSFEVSPRAGFIAQDLFVVDHHKHLEPMYHGNLSATVNVMRLVKMAEAKIMTVVFQTKTKAVGSEEERLLLIKELELYGFFNIDVMKVVHYPKTPTRVPVDAIVVGWYEKAEAAQGTQELYFIGETFSGHGVPTTFIHTRDWITRTFNLSVAESMDYVKTPGTAAMEAAEKLTIFAATERFDARKATQAA